MLKFSILFKSGIPIYEQVAFGIKKAIISGQLKPGDQMPSVREISKELRVSPITIQKAISQLVRDNLLETRVGIGTVVSEFIAASREKKMALLGEDLNHMIIEAKSLGISKRELIEAIGKLIIFFPQADELKRPVPFSKDIRLLMVHAVGLHFNIKS